ncbi:hypothetical protein K2Y11_17640 [bacterium]|nr:hypothetical protein [bacterium]
MSYESRLPLTLIKVGGSLFDLPDLPHRLHELFASAGRKVLLFGGGDDVDALRRRTSTNAISEEDAHWEAIRLMSSSAVMQSRRWPLAHIIHSFDELMTSHAPLVIFDTAYELKRDAGHSLPIGWHVTSDSIAAWIALKSDATELVLLKSVGREEPFSIVQAVEYGWLDAYFPTIAKELEIAGIEISWINARGSSLNRLPLRVSKQVGDRDA